ncbi:MAG: c-type cytochrome [Alphaproteobacteria bacterium]|nr:c-type cytochrome [Alphaproteobacteria bacterium]
MQLIRNFTAVFAVSLSLAAAASGATVAQPTNEPVTSKSPERFKHYTLQGIPVAFRGKTNPLPINVGNVIKGADLYNARCASCHGPMGFGNGAAGGALRPRPADLAWSLSDPRVKDDFLLWTITEGGAQFGSNMPAFKGDLSENRIWEIVTYMRAAFEGREASGPDRTGKLAAR